MKNKGKIRTLILWLIAYTWGCVLTLIGGVIALILLLTGHFPQKFGPCICFELKAKGGWGLNLGPFFIYTKGAGDFNLKCHECGHFVAQIWWGPFFPFVVSLPSAIRFWLREQKDQSQKYVFAALVLNLIIGTGVICVAIGIVYHLLLWFLGIFIIIYGAIIGLWLFKKEIPKYANNQKVPYDDFWPEAQATREGTKFIQTYYPNIE